MLHDLRHRDLSAYRPHEIPVTEALRQQKILSLAPHEKWWLQKLNDGRLLPGHEGWRTEVPRDALYDDYIAVTGKAGVSPRAIATEVGIHLMKLLPERYLRRFQRTILTKVQVHCAGEHATESEVDVGFPPLSTPLRNAALTSHEGHLPPPLSGRVWLTRSRPDRKNGAA